MNLSKKKKKRALHVVYLQNVNTTYMQKEPNAVTREGSTFTLS